MQTSTLLHCFYTKACANLIRQGTLIIHQNYRTFTCEFYKVIVKQRRLCRIVQFNGRFMSVAVGKLTSSKYDMHMNG